MNQLPNHGPTKSRDALLAAFESLVVSKPYPQISVGSIVSKADVGRSTFYDHFQGKDDLLRQSLTPVLDVLAAAARSDCDHERLAFVLEHFQQVGEVARGFVNGSGGALLVAALQEAIFEKQATQVNATRTLSPEFAAQLAAETIVALTRAWLNNSAQCCAKELAARMNRAAVACCTS